MDKKEGYIRVLRIIIPYIFFSGFFQLIGFLLLDIDVFSGERPDSTFEYSVIMFFTLIGTLLTVWLFNNKMDEESISKLGLSFKGHIIDFIFGFSITGILITSGFFILFSVKEISVLSWQFETSDLLWSILLFIFVSVGEEVIMRGYVLNNLMISLSPKIALLVSSLIFGLLHFTSPDFSFLPFVNLVLAGIFLGVPFIFNRNLWFPIAGHLAWNFLQAYVFGFKVSGREIDSIIVLDEKSETIWNGGNFGFEGSILCTLLMLVGIFITYSLYKRRYA